MPRGSRRPGRRHWPVRLEAAPRALPEQRRRYSVLPLPHGYREPEPAVPGSVVPSDRFRAAVRRTGVGAARGIPLLSAELVLKYASDLRRLMTG
ncbi:hypothetical protein [Streptomyces sp. NRRL S-31]|uniref:hypothetical protein n=1 Tax=Streptomyces sp. NRRL S-31 TaxID=1463898 RepID=UPI0004C5C25B|nr:hypothetical protein [Streptomyces sp. NRRL S-31]